jgi:hypothetical protein
LWEFFSESHWLCIQSIWEWSTIGFGKEYHNFLKLDEYHSLLSGETHSLAQVKSGLIFCHTSAVTFSMSPVFPYHKVYCIHEAFKIVPEEESPSWCSGVVVSISVDIWDLP